MKNSAARPRRRAAAAAVQVDVLFIIGFSAVADNES